MYPYDYKHELERTFEAGEVLKGLGNNFLTATKMVGRLLRLRKKT